MINIITIFFLMMFLNDERVLAVLFGSSSENKSELVAVTVIYRHGDRAPIVSFPTDKYFNRIYWPAGFSQLTKTGINRQYKLGQWLRQRYSTFLSDIYSPEEIYVYSTNVDRTLSSAYANLAGLYPPKNFQIWNENIPWQPIPVHTHDRKSDDIIVQKRKCRKSEHMLKKMKEKVYIPVEQKYADMFKYVSNHTGWNKVSVDEIRRLRAVFYAYNSYNTSFIPDWAKDLDQDVLNYVAAVGFEIQTHTAPLARLRIGPFFHHLQRYFHSFVARFTQRKPKFLMVSAHDTTVSAVLGAMGAYKFRPVNFADTVIWELRRKSDRSYFVNTLYKRGDDLEEVNVKNCNFDCDFDDFKYRMSNVTVSIYKWLKECNI